MSLASLTLWMLYSRKSNEKVIKIISPIFLTFLCCLILLSFKKFCFVYFLDDGPLSGISFCNLSPSLMWLSFSFLFYWYYVFSDWKFLILMITNISYLSAGPFFSIQLSKKAVYKVSSRFFSLLTLTLSIIKSCKTWTFISFFSGPLPRRQYSQTTRETLPKVCRTSLWFWQKVVYAANTLGEDALIFMEDFQIS